MLVAVSYIGILQQVLYLLTVRPNEHPKEQLLEVLSEALLTYFFYGMLICEAWTDPLTRFKVGWFAVASMAVLFIAMLGNIINDSVHANWNELRRQYYKRRQAYLRAKIEKGLAARKARIAKQKEEEEKQRQEESERKALFVIQEENEQDEESHANEP